MACLEQHLEWHVVQECLLLQLCIPTVSHQKVYTLPAVGGSRLYTLDMACTVVLLDDQSVCPRLVGPTCISPTVC